MDKNILINGNTYNNISSIKVKDAETAELHTYRNTDDADIDSSNVLIGKIGYNNNGKVIGAYIPPSTVGSGETDYEDGINFYDYYGQKIASYRLEDLPLNALPEIPALEGVGADQYTFAWSMTLDEVNALTEDTDIGVDVTANEGAKTYLFPTARGYAKSSNYYRIQLCGGDTASTVLIDWGDGQTSTVSLSANASKQTSHTFAEESHNPISIEKTAGGDFYLGAGTSGTTTKSFLYCDTSNYNWNTLADRTIEVRVGAGVKGLSNYTFYRTAMEKIILPNNIVDILATNYIFSDCKVLRSLNLPKSIKTIPATLLYNCYSLESLFLHEGLEQSASLASACYPLKKLVLPKTYKTLIASSIVSGGHTLRKLKFPSTAECTNSYGFGISSAYSIEKVTIPKTTTLGDNFCNQCSALKEIEFPEGLTTIGRYFAQNCYSLKGIEIPEGVTTIGQYFAQGCYALESVIFPASLTSLGGGVLYNAGYSVKQIIMKGSTPPALSGEIYNSGSNFKIYVPAGSLADYAAATNWTAYAPYMEEY